jgi:hypothetical protein
MKKQQMTNRLALARRLDPDDRVRSGGGTNIVAADVHQRDVLGIT